MRFSYISRYAPYISRYTIMGYFRFPDEPIENISNPKSYYVRLFFSFCIIHIMSLLFHIMPLLFHLFFQSFWSIMSYYVKFSKTAIISITSILLYQFFFHIYYFNYINYNSIMTLIFNQMYYVTYFF